MRVQISFLVVLILLISILSFSATVQANDQRAAEDRVAKFAGAVASLLHSVDEKGWTKVLRPLVNKGIDYCVNGLNAMLAPPEHMNL